MADSKIVKNSAIAKLLNISEGLLENLTDVVLFSLFFGFEASMVGYGRTWKAERKAHDDLSELNYRKIKRTINNLKQKGLVEIIKEDNKLPVITETGRIRIQNIIPKYEERRIWDHKIYMVTYDIPVARNKDRNKLREYLKNIGCAGLQDSVWITAYNPTGLVEEFVTKQNMEGNLIIVSSIGKDGTIGGMETKDMVEKIYDLSEISEQYLRYLVWVRDSNPNRIQIISRFLAILKNDPQLPFELLPDSWAGEKAYRLYKSALNN